MNDFEMSIIATEVGFEAVGDLVDYYIKMLALAVASIAGVTNREPNEVYEALEENLGLSGKLDSYLGTLRASTEINKSAMEE